VFFTPASLLRNMEHHCASATPHSFPSKPQNKISANIYKAKRQKFPALFSLTFWTQQQNSSSSDLQEICVFAENRIDYKGSPQLGPIVIWGLRSPKQTLRAFFCAMHEKRPTLGAGLISKNIDAYFLLFLGTPFSTQPAVGLDSVTNNSANVSLRIALVTNSFRFEDARW